MAQQKELLSKEDLQNEFSEYKKFAFKGDMIKMAIAFILGGAFNKVVTSISENLMMPLLNFIVSKTGGNWREAVWAPVEGLAFEIGQFAAVAVDFLLITIVLFVMWRILKGHVGDDEEGPPLMERLKDFVLGDWFFLFAAVLAIIIVVFSQSWMAGVWAFVGMSLAVSWFQNRELRRKAKVQEEKMQQVEQQALVSEE